MLQYRGVRANTRGVKEVVLRRIAFIKSSVVLVRKESPALEADVKRVEN